MKPRAKIVILDKPAECCGSQTVMDINGVYKCPCGKSHERAVVPPPPISTGNVFRDAMVKNRGISTNQ